MLVSFFIVATVGAVDCVDDNEGFVKAANGAFPTCEEAASHNGCTNPLFGATMRQLCCKSCQQNANQCLDNDASIAGITAGKAATCAAAVQQGFCVESPFAQENHQLPQIVGNGSACCKSCEKFQEAPFDIPEALKRFTLSQFKSCEEITSVDGCFLNKTLGGLHVQQLARNTCGGSCKNRGALRVCADNDEILGSRVKPITFQGRTQNLTCALAKAGGCDPAFLDPAMSASAAKTTKEILDIVCCDSCNPQRVQAAASANSKVIAKEVEQSVADRKKQLNALTTNLVGLAAIAELPSNKTRGARSGTLRGTLALP